MTTVDEAWLRPVLEAWAGSTTQPVTWSVATWEGGVRLALTVGDRAVHLDLHPRRDGPAYATTPSLSLYVGTDGAPLDDLDHALSALIARVAAVDPGDLEVPKGASVPDGQAAVPVAEPGREPVIGGPDALMLWVRAAADLPDRLARAATWAHAARRTGARYPFAAALGRPDGDEAADEALRAWVIDRVPGGFGRDAFLADWALDDGARLGAILAPLVAVGACTQDDDGVHFFVGEAGDVAIWSVFLWSDAVRARAAAVWGVSPDPGARAALDAIERGGGTGTGAG